MLNLPMLHVRVCVFECLIEVSCTCIATCTKYTMNLLVSVASFVLLCAGFVAGNYARVLSGPHKGLQGKVGTHMCMCMCVYKYYVVHVHVLVRVHCT